MTPAGATFLGRPLHRSTIVALAVVTIGVALTVPEVLTGDEPGTVTWTADAPSVLTPELGHDDESGLDATVVIERLIDHLRRAAPAWNPYA